MPWERYVRFSDGFIIIIRNLLTLSEKTSNHGIVEWMPLKNVRGFSIFFANIVINKLHTLYCIILFL